MDFLFSVVRLLTLSPKAMNPPKHLDSLTSFCLQLMDFNLQYTANTHL